MNREVVFPANKSWLGVTVFVVFLMQQELSPMHFNAPHVPSRVLSLKFDKKQGLLDDSRSFSHSSSC